MWELGAVLWLVSGCAPKVISIPPTTPRPSPPPAVEKPAEEPAQPAPPEPQPSPRALASLHLTEQGRLFLERGQLDNAISTLERAMSLHPANGQNYYYLSEAWLLKGNTTQAMEFNRLAEIYFRDDPRWMKAVKQQKLRIETRRRERGE
jgi:tetratricopeptide (TPR) repeat protein